MVVSNILEFKNFALKKDQKELFAVGNNFESFCEKKDAEIRKKPKKMFGQIFR